MPKIMLDYSVRGLEEYLKSKSKNGMVPSPCGQAAVRQRFGTIQAYFYYSTHFSKKQ